MNENRFVRILKQAKKEKKAIGAFNFFNYISANAVIKAAEECGSSVILQVSVPTVHFYGVETLMDFVTPLIRGSSSTVALHLDHCKDPELAKECIRAGWDAVMMDYSALPLEENIRKTAEIVEYAHHYGVAVEGEVGVISGVEDDISHTVSVTADALETKRFIFDTAVDAIAPAIGTSHGLYRGAPSLNYELVRELGQGECPLVIHGGTGLAEDTFRRLVQLGAAKINISTALKLAYRDSIQNMDVKTHFTPLEADQAFGDAIRQVAVRNIQIFAGEERTVT